MATKLCSSIHTLSLKRVLLAVPWIISIMSYSEMLNMYVRIDDNCSNMNNYCTH